ncbi:FtsK/SpoIIIE domain-containing protein [Candidatus Frankia nodulisporulans]|uniref:FtsK/SpoIIIE domain-containing protein n=1 Tax=Candidatus Frankia nodulisporulans TaxID=2060052 RepID=UPI001CDBD222|nr:FtsK/SpoIIIE domain-containing protein [Candidatus Frankia nodulisporulans]
MEVWPTEPRDAPGVLDLWVADQGSLTKPVAPWPLLTTGVADYFKGVPVGVDPRGNIVLGRLFQANWGVAGMMGSGKSTLIITALLGAILDPLVEIDVYCMAVNADYDPLRPRLRTLFVSDDPDEIPTVLAALKQLMSELSDRGRKLSAAGEPELTRALAEADPGMRPRIVVIDECQELFVSDVGDEAAELVEKIVAKARKYGVTLIFATPVPSADSLPRKVAKVLSNRACFAIADHQGNDAILGTGKHRAGISATTLRPMTVAADGAVDLGDLGTAMASGFTPTDGLLRCFYVRRGDGVDDVTPVVERAMANLAPGTLTAALGSAGATAEPETRDLLDDLDEVLGTEVVRIADVPPRLRELAPGWGPYRKLTGADLVKQLAAEGIKVPSTGNRWPLDPVTVRKEIGRRSTVDLDE